MSEIPNDDDHKPVRPEEAGQALMDAMLGAPGHEERVADITRRHYLTMIVNPMIEHRRRDPAWSRGVVGPTVERYLARCMATMEMAYGSLLGLSMTVTQIEIERREAVARQANAVDAAAQLAAEHVQLTETVARLEAEVIRLNAELEQAQGRLADAEINNRTVED